MSDDIPGVHSEGCLIVLCAGGKCQSAQRSADDNVWSLLHRALGRVVRRIPRSVLVTTDCLGHCASHPDGVHVASQTRQQHRVEPASRYVVTDRAGAALLCGSLLRREANRNA